MFLNISCVQKSREVPLVHTMLAIYVYVCLKYMDLSGIHTLGIHIHI